MESLPVIILIIFVIGVNRGFANSRNQRMAIKTPDDLFTEKEISPCSIQCVIDRLRLHLFSTSMRNGATRFFQRGDHPNISCEFLGGGVSRESNKKDKILENREYSFDVKKDIYLFIDL